MLDNENIKCGVSDIFSGLTMTRVVGRYGHRPPYWNGEALERETIADFFDARGCGGEKLKILKEHFPTAYKYFDDFLRSIK